MSYSVPQIVQEVKPPADPTGERLVDVLLDLQLRQRRPNPFISGVT
jgi:hypothetical protein